MYGIALGISETQEEAMPAKNCEALMGIDFQSFPDADYCMGINPHSFDEKAAAELENIIKTDRHLVGFKIYGGYYHYFLTDKVYAPVFELAEQYGLPVTFHSGDTYSKKALLKYAHPLVGDEVAQTYPKANLILAHMGNPWIIDAAEVAYKNDNVYVDLAGLYIGKNFRKCQFDNQILQYHSLGLKLLHNYEKVLYGSDWPLVSMHDYIYFIKRIVPEKEHDKVFRQNALHVFSRLHCCENKR